MKRCHQCLKEVAVQKVIGRKDTCPFCSAELRCCLNCRFYDPQVYNQCRESQAERVLEKDRSNFCDYFNFKEAEAEPELAAKQTARDKLESLFKK
ncbi:MAG: hypothetical protein JW902_18775 [Syntrophaceae bacterium]|nr:hypothetical protein [Syntrophaceae bacterium]